MAEERYEPRHIDVAPDGLHVVWKDGVETLLPTATCAATAAAHSASTRSPTPGASASTTCPPT